MYERFDQKYKECEKALFLVAIGYLHNTEDAKDCLQEAVLSALKSFDTLKNQAYFKTWLTRIVINKCKDFIKRRRFTEELSDTLNVFYDMPMSEFGIVDLICRMDPKKALYITTYKDMACVLRQPISTVKYKTQKAFKELKEELEGDV